MRQIIFIVIGIIAGLLAIFTGDLRQIDQFLVGMGVSTLLGALAVTIYNAKTSPPLDSPEVLNFKAMPYLENILYSVGGSIITILCKILFFP